MSLARFEKNYRQTNLNGTLNLPATIKSLKQAMTLLDAVYHRALAEI
ncbi:hypothetical protein [Commensalibacter nepenthis]|uniref:Uncharacterized protein n=1 Tax=Commensalibacter nepenthis TaxID=3043872 RepID=A0ABT6QAI2_9PROT|nr:hypothetical protein [Commensalibacter sp. TBRC 10068]MDI2113253.1 hypothetical protein [Commensalibacter sp. TBRC 10068]